MAEIDAEQLLHLARAKSAEGRKALSEAIAGLFAGAPGVLSERERALMYDILHKVVFDAEMEVRRAVSEKLARLDDVPHQLVRMLANDVGEVAYPVLVESRVLADSDLIEVIRNRTLEHQLAIAMRYSVSEGVSAILAETGNEPVIDALLRNENARISRRTLAFIVEESRRVDAFREPLLLRSELGSELAQRMLLWVSAALRKHILERFEIDEETVDRILQEAALGEQRPDGSGQGEGAAERLAGDLAEQGLLDPALLIRALGQGEVNLFVGLFSGATGLRPHLVRRLLFEPGGEGLAIACKAIGLDRRTFFRVFGLSRGSRPGAAADRKRETQAVLSFYDRVPAEVARRVVHRWRLHPDYAAAIRDLELGAGVDG
jgi:uncharacterized protein (DUF2336 family)